MKLIFLILLLLLAIGCTANEPVVCEEIGGICQKQCTSAQAQYHGKSYCEWRTVCCVPDSALQW